MCAWPFYVYSATNSDDPGGLGRQCYQSSFTEEEAEAQKGKRLA